MIVAGANYYVVLTYTHFLQCKLQVFAEHPNLYLVVNEESHFLRGKIVEVDEDYDTGQTIPTRTDLWSIAEVEIDCGLDAG